MSTVVLYCWGHSDNEQFFVFYSNISVIHVCNCFMEPNTIFTVTLPTPLSIFPLNSVFIRNTSRRVPQSICYNLLWSVIQVYFWIHISRMWHVYAVLRYSIPKVWIDNSYQATPGNSCHHACFFFCERNLKLVCMISMLHCRDLTLPTKFSHWDLHYLVLIRKFSSTILT